MAAEENTKLSNPRNLGPVS